MFRADGRPIEWTIFNELVPFPVALEAMRAQVTRIAKENGPEKLWLLEHPPLYTSGTSARADDLVDPDRFPVFEAGRGGQYTYHGPGQRVAYVMLDLSKRGKDVRQYVRGLEKWIIGTLAEFNIDAFQRNDRVGVWVRRSDKGPLREDKIAAIGVRVSKWVSFHGICLNISPELSHYDGIVPCGISDQGVTSFEDLGHLVSMEEVDGVLRHKFAEQFGAISDHQSEPAFDTSGLSTRRS